MTETVNRILNLMKNNGDNAHSLEMKANLPISSIAGWKKDKFQPSTDSIVKLARYFGVSTDYLLGLSEDPAQKNFVNSPVVTGNDNAVAVNGSTIYAAGAVALDDELIRLYREFSEAEKSILLGYAKRIVEERKK